MRPEDIDDSGTVGRSDERKNVASGAKPDPA